MKRNLIWAVPMLSLAVLSLMAPVRGEDKPASLNSSADKQAKILILTGNEYPGHKWKETAPFLCKFLATDRRLATSVNENASFLASQQLNDYDAIVLNYMNWESPDPGEAAPAEPSKFVAGGKGLVLVHFACGAFQGWPEFRNIAGRTYDPKLRPHDPHGKFTVTFPNKEDPITKGMKPFETVDELYTCLAGDKEIQVVATAVSKVDKKDYPMAFLNCYGKGRVFHCVLGHDVRGLTPTVCRNCIAVARRGPRACRRSRPPGPLARAFERATTRCVRVTTVRNAMHGVQFDLANLCRTTVALGGWRIRKTDRRADNAMHRGATPRRFLRSSAEPMSPKSEPPLSQPPSLPPPFRLLSPFAPRKFRSFAERKATPTARRARSVPRAKRAGPGSPHR